MPTAGLTRVTFRVKADLEIGQNIRLAGDTRALGSFHPNRGLDLVTTPGEYPWWRTNKTVNVPAGVPLSYKYVIVSGGLFHGWEPISAHARVIVPSGADLEVVDEVGVYSEDAHGGYHHESGRVLRSAHSGSSEESDGSLGLEGGGARGEGGAAPPLSSSAPGLRSSGAGVGAGAAGKAQGIHPHVRFQIDEDAKIEAAAVMQAARRRSADAAPALKEAILKRSLELQAASAQAAEQPHGRAAAPAQDDSEEGRSTARSAERWASPGSGSSGAAAAESTPSSASAVSWAVKGAAEAAALERTGSGSGGARRRALSEPRVLQSERAEPSWTPGGASSSSPGRASSSSGSPSGSPAPRGARATSKDYRMFLVSYNLPVLLWLERSAPAGSRWRVEWDPNSISRKSEGSVANDHSVRWLGAITPYIIVDDDMDLCWSLTAEDRAEITSRLAEMDCVPLFPDKDLFVDHYVRCSLLRFKDVFHNVLITSLPAEEMRRLENEHHRRRADSTGVFSTAAAGAAAGEVSQLRDPYSAPEPPSPAQPEQASPSSSSSSPQKQPEPRRKRDRWAGYVKGCTQFADKLMELLTAQTPTERDLVWVHNYPLMMLPQLLREKAGKLSLPLVMQPKIVFFLHTPFPTSEIFRTLSVRNELLEGVLGANVVGFHTFDHARHFITSCKRFLGLQFHSQQGGRLVVDHMDRSVLIAISHVGIERGLLENACASRQCAAAELAIRQKYKGKVIIVAMDELTRLQGVPLKLLAFERLLQEVPRYRNKLVFVQHGLHTLQSRLVAMAESDLLGMPQLRDEVEEPRAVVEVRELCERINRAFGPVVVFKEYPVHKWPTVEQRAAIWRTADIMACTPVCEGLNLLPLEYVYCHRDPGGVLVLSEFSAASKVLNGALRINCYDMVEISSAYDQAVQMSANERNARRDRDCSYISNRSSAAWTRNILLDVEAGILSAAQALAPGGADEQLVQDNAYCQPLIHADLLRSYQHCRRRLILLDYAGTLAPRELGNLAVKRDFLGVSKRKLQPRILSILRRLCSDPANIVFVISGNSPQVLSQAFAEVLADPATPLGIVAHSGVMIRFGYAGDRHRRDKGDRDMYPSAFPSSASAASLTSSGASIPSRASASSCSTSPEQAGLGLLGQIVSASAAALGGAALGPAAAAMAAMAGSTQRGHGHVLVSTHAGEAEWEYLLPGVADEWARWIEAADIPSILEDYSWRTGGSSWRLTEVTASWQFRQADPEWGGMQALKLERELEEAITQVNVPVQIMRKKHTVELLPRGVDKGQAVSYIVEQLRRRLGFEPDFCLCVGDDTSDEPMYAAVLDFMGGKPHSAAAPEDPPRVEERFSHSYTCTVGRKPTTAQYYVQETANVLLALERLAAHTESGDLD
jgi:trehalose-6-phosphate synthase/trehalose-6-phosphatase